MRIIEPCRRGPDGAPCGRAARTPRLVAGDCPRCWVNQWTRDELRALAAPQRPAPVARGVCLHLGPQLSAFDRPKCQRLYTCDKGHGGAAGVCPSKHCRTCPDHEAETSSETSSALPS